MHTDGIDIAALEKQVQLLRRASRRDRIAAIGIIVLLGGLLFARTGTAPKLPDELRARRLVLVDANGLTRAAIAVTETGVPLFNLWDANGKVRLQIGLESDAARLLLIDEAGITRAALRQGGRFGGSGLDIQDEKGETRAGIGVGTAGDPALYMSGPKDGGRLSLGVSDFFGAHLHLSDKSGIPHVLLSLDEKSISNLHFLDPRGKDRLCLGLSESGEASLVFRDDQMNARVQLGGTAASPTRSLRFLGKDGRVEWEAP